MFQYGFKKWLHVLGFVIQVAYRVTIASRRLQHGEVQLFRLGGQLQEQVLH